MSDLSRACSAATYRNVEFPVADLSTSWGHDSATHQGYLQRGAIKETTGQKPRQFTLKIPLRNGLRGWAGERLFPELYVRLRKEFETAEGFLTHPLYGLVTVHIDDVREIADPKMGDGLDLEVTCTEQNSENQLLDLTGPSAASPSEAAVAYATEADAEATGLTLSASNSASLADLLGETFDYLQAAERTYADASSSFVDALGAIGDRIEDAGAADASAHDFREALARCRAAVVAYRVEYLGTSAPETATLPEGMSLARAALLAYGDVSRSGELARKNRILDPTFLPAGTVLYL